jgi:hypothetical protein
MVGAPVLSYDTPMPERPFPELQSFIAQVNQTAAGNPDAIQAVADAAKRAIAIEADATKLCGVLIEAIAMTVWQRVPKEKQASLSSDILKLMYARFDSLNLLQPPADEA